MTIDFEIDLFDEDLPQLATVERWLNNRPRADGVVKPSYAQVATDVRCMVQETPGRIRINDQGLDLMYSAFGLFNFVANVQPKSGNAAHPDRITVGGKKYLVQHAADPTGHQHHLELYLIKV
mgnify:CR=1 FL=1